MGKTLGQTISEHWLTRYMAFGVIVVGATTSILYTVYFNPKIEQADYRTEREQDAKQALEKEIVLLQDELAKCKTKPQDKPVKPATATTKIGQKADNGSVNQNTGTIDIK